MAGSSGAAGKWRAADKPASLAASRRCAWAFTQDKAAVSPPGRGRERVLTARRISLHQRESSCLLRIAWNSTPAAGHFTFETEAQRVKGGMAHPNSPPERELGAPDREPARLQRPSRACRPPPTAEPLVRALAAEGAARAWLLGLGQAGSSLGPPTARFLRTWGWRRPRLALCPRAAMVHRPHS